MKWNREIKVIEEIGLEEWFRSSEDSEIKMRR
jgi:hypothetical protein